MTETDRDDNSVGYGRPPKLHRFKKGTSGNPKGRPKKPPPGITTIVDEFFKEEIPFSEGGKRKLATRDEVRLKALRKHAIAGNVSAAEQIINILQSVSTSGHGTTHVLVRGGLREE